MDISTLSSVIIFFLGAIIGSFLNVVILRFRTGKTLGGRSHCGSCNKVLGWSELLPIGSWLSQRGKCTVCHTKISAQYPLVEAVTGLLFVFLYWKIGGLLLVDPLWFGILFVYYACIFSLLVILTVYDVRHKILPDRWVFLFGLLSLGALFLSSEGFQSPDLSYLLAGIVIPLPFAILWLISRGRWMGFGDAKLAVGMGLLLGLEGGLAALLLAFWTGAIYGVLLILSSHVLGRARVTLKSTVPFGPFLILGTLLVFFGVDLAVIMSLFG